MHIASETGDITPEEAAAIEQAIHSAIAAGIGRADRPIAFGLQPILEVNLTLTDDARMRELNRDYRGQDKPTDVLSFSQIEDGMGFVPAPSGSLMLGDIVISVETAQRQAKSSLVEELRLLAAHGALHLLGYDHQTDEDEARMNVLTRQALGNQPVT